MRKKNKKETRVNVFCVKCRGRFIIWLHHTTAEIREYGDGFSSRKTQNVTCPYCACKFGVVIVRMKKWIGEQIGVWFVDAIPDEKPIFRKRKNLNWQARYQAGEFPECFVPCPPFFDFCNSHDLSKEKCKKCFEEFGFVDYIE